MRNSTKDKMEGGAREIKGKLKELKGNFKQKWGELTDDDWKQVSGNSLQNRWLPT